MKLQYTLNQLNSQVSVLALLAGFNNNEKLSECAKFISRWIDNYLISKYKNNNTYMLFENIEMI